VSRLRIAPRARLRFDRLELRHVLLSPERGLALSETATLIVQLCDGASTEAGIVDACVARYGEEHRARIEVDVRAVIADLLARGLLVAVEPE
jgi:coenzyme PQQ biosynthesis protein PqqD